MPPPAVCMALRGRLRNLSLSLLLPRLSCLYMCRGSSSSPHLCTHTYTHTCTHTRTHTSVLHPKHVCTSKYVHQLLACGQERREYVCVCVCVCVCHTCLWCVLGCRMFPALLDLCRSPLPSLSIPCEYLRVTHTHRYTYICLCSFLLRDYLVTRRNTHAGNGTHTHIHATYILFPYLLSRSIASSLSLSISALRMSPARSACGVTHIHIHTYTHTQMRHTHTHTHTHTSYVSMHHM